MPSNKLKVVLIHWFPIEQFPPAQNLVNELADTDQIEVTCCTTNKASSNYSFSNDKVSFRRSPFPLQGQLKLIRLLRFLYFPWMCFFTVILNRPSVLIYIDPHSATAAFLPLLLLPKCRLVVHYHEYREPSHFRDRGNALARLGNLLEKWWLHRRAAWISHTNHDRIRLFLSDNPGVSPKKMHTVPNLPPSSWLSSADSQAQKESGPLRLVYIGAASLRDTYIQNLVLWFQNLPKNSVLLDLYINNSDPSTENFLNQQKTENLRVYMGGVPYYQLPKILPRYDVGLILYRCTTTNYIYNAPNKLFEYLTCGLSVVYPNQMLGVHPYARTNCQPWVKSVDFDHLSDIGLNELNSKHNPTTPWTETCNQALRPLIDFIKNQQAN